MKVNVKKLRDFISRVHLKNINDKCIVEFGNDGMLVQTKNVAGVVGVRGLLKKEAITDYKELGKVAFNNLELFVSALGTFNDKDEVEMIFERDGKDKFYSKITIVNTKGRKFNHMLGLVESIKEYDLSKVSEIPFEEEVVIPISGLKEATRLGGLMGAERMIINANGKTLKLIVTNDMGSDFDVPVEVESELKNDYSIRVPNSIFKMIDSINLDVKAKMHTDDNVPFIYTNVDGDNEFTFVIAKKSLED